MLRKSVVYHAHDEIFCIAIYLRDDVGNALEAYLLGSMKLTPDQFSRLVCGFDGDCGRLHV
jgi:hypothetical protein